MRVREVPVLGDATGEHHHHEAGPRTRTLAAGVFVLVVSLAFWLLSRYPALNDKATMTGAVDKTNPLGFGVAVSVAPTDPFLWRVFATTVNWLYSNMFGMSFGLVVAAGILTLVSTLHHRGARSGFGSSVMGTFIGAPLGLCANCAAPVAGALATSGVRIEGALSAMIASPTLNVVVLTMVVALFPTYMVALKVGATLLVLLLVVPLVGRLVKAEEPSEPLVCEACETATGERIGASLVWTARAVGRNLWFVVRTAVPLMVLAGALGALAITILPWDSLADVLPEVTGFRIVVALVAVALIGVFLPMPVAFDVVTAAVLFAAGMPAAYVMVLLFTLGVFSIYPYSLIGRRVSWRVATSLALTLVLLGVGVGAFAYSIDRRDEARLGALLDEELAAAASRSRPESVTAGARPDEEILGDLAAGAVSWETVGGASASGVTVERAPLAETTGAEGLRFTRIDGRDIGFADRPSRNVLEKYLIPFVQLGGVASGDVHGDGSDDVLVATEKGLSLYANRADGTFEPQRLDAGEPADGPVGAAMLVDLDADGWLDVLFSGWRKGLHVAYNDEGRFSGAEVEHLWEGPADIALAMAAGDLDVDGDLDLVVGNYAGGLGEFAFPESRNVILRNTGDGFEAEELPGVPGPTLTTLVSNLNGDAIPDLLVGNDFSEPDIYYLSDRDWWRQVSASDGVVPHSGLTTMSFDSADVDNDLELEVYVGQASQPQREIPAEALCERLDRPDDRQDCRDSLPVARASLGRKAAPSACAELGDRDRAACYAYGLFRQAREANDPEVCAPVREAFPKAWDVCSYFGRTPERGRTFPGEIPSLQEGNIFLVRDGEGLADRAEEAGIRKGGWTWNAKFADLDNDGWQDLYVVNGWPGLPVRESNILYRNLRGQGFAEATEEAGMEDYLDTYAYTYIDHDGDGDLDVLALPAGAPPVLWRNDTAAASIEIELLDRTRPNRRAVGATVAIEYGDGDAQLREVKTGGGYLSFDPPKVHFGLGDVRSVEAIVVLWPDGAVTELEGPIAVDSRYRLVREGAEEDGR